MTAFLTWAAEPTLAERKKIGLRVMIFLIVLAGALFPEEEGLGDAPLRLLAASAQPEAPGAGRFKARSFCSARGFRALGENAR